MFKVILGSFNAFVSICAFVYKACNSKTAGRRVKRTEIMKLEDTSDTYGKHLTLYGSVSFWGHLVHISQNGPYLKMAGRRAKRTVVTHIWGTFDLVAFKVILESSVHLSQNGL